MWATRSASWEYWEPVVMHCLSGVNPTILGALRLRPGSRVVDVGCGTGDPALELARWVGPRGRVLGLDLSPGMLRTARQRARILGLRNVSFRRADAARLKPEGPRFDALCARFSLMFADDVERALRGMLAWLKPGGRAAFTVWATLKENPGTRLRMEAARPFARGAEEDPEKMAHPMRLGRRGLLPGLMRKAGFKGVRAESVRLCWMYPSLEAAVEMQLMTGLRQLHESLSRKDQARLRAAVTRKYRRFVTGEVVRFPGTAWVVSGSRPASKTR
jgi:ubiquinone/menaquinone biosynthesis C-methylase UbiE